MQAIEVKFISVTNNRPNRVKAFCNAGSITLEAMDVVRKCKERGIPTTEENYAKFMADALGTKLNWVGFGYGKMVMGTLKNGNYVFVFTEREETK